MKDFLFNDLINDLSNYGKDDWVTVFEDFDIENIESGTLYAVLVDKDYSKEMLEYPGWGISINAFKPGFVHYSDEEPQYFRFGLEHPIEPLIIQRFFNNVYPTIYEVSEEFRHYHNLYFNPKTNKFTSVGVMSDESEVVQIEKDLIKIRRKPLKEFLSAKNMNLVLLFDVFRYTSKDLKHFEVSVRDEFEHQDDTCQYILNFQRSSLLDENPNNKYNSRLLGKKIITGFKDFKPRSDFDIVENKQFVEFIVQEDEEGNIITSTSDPNLLTYSGTDVHSQHFFTPVFFKKDVLKKYYDTPDRFAVEDGSLSCKGSWRLEIDNNQKNYVIVYLGDLGRNLSFEEQLYWRSFNVIPDGVVSRVKFHRDFLNKMHPPEAADLLFRRKFDEFQNLCAERYGYTLFLILTSDDLYHYSYLHTPLSNNQVEFEQMILSLSKILSDSINEKQIEREQPSCKEIKGKIHKLEHYLRLTEFPEINSTGFLNELQMIRSLSVAHRKGRDYVKLFEKLRFEERTFQDVFNDILMRATKFLEYLTIHLSNSPSNKI